MLFTISLFFSITNKKYFSYTLLNNFFKFYTYRDNM